MNDLLNIYECKRYSDPQDRWRGAVIVGANNEAEAIKIATEFDDAIRPITYCVEHWPEIYGVGEPHVMYNDEKR